MENPELSSFFFCRVKKMASIKTTNSFSFFSFFSFLPALFFLFFTFFFALSFLFFFSYIFSRVLERLCMKESLHVSLSLFPSFNSSFFSRKARGKIAKRGSRIKRETHKRVFYRLMIFFATFFQTLSRSNLG